MSKASDSSFKAFMAKCKKHKGKYILLTVLYVLGASYLGGLITQSQMVGIFNSGGASMQYNPFTCWKYAILYGRSITVVIMVLGIVIAVVLKVLNYQKTGLYDPERNFEYSEKDTYGTSGWMTEAEREESLDLLPIEDTYGVILGAIDNDIVSVVPAIHAGIADKFDKAQKKKSYRTNGHVCVMGASGSMKSRTYVRNNIFQCIRRGESLVITDPKGEMYEDMAVMLKSEGYDVKVFNLKDQIFSDSWACLEEVGTDEIAAQTFCSIIIQNTSDGKGDHFWDNGEMNLLKALVLYVCVENRKLGEPVTMAEVYRLLTTTSAEDLDLMFKSLDKSHPAYAPYAIYSQATENTRASFCIGLGTRLQVFQSQLIKEITSYPEIDLTKPGRTKCAYFCAMSDQDSTFKFLSSLFFSFLFMDLVKYADNYGKVPGKLDTPVNFILDEFSNIGQIPDIEKKISTVRSRGIAISIIIQNLPQLKNRYPNDVWQEIIGNCDVQLFLGCTDETTSLYISNRSGVATIDIASEKIQRSRVSVVQIVPEVSETQSVGKRNVLTQDEVLRLSTTEALIVVRGEKLLKVDKYDFSRHPYSKRMIPCRMSERVPKWRTTSEFGIQVSKEFEAAKAARAAEAEAAKSEGKIESPETAKGTRLEKRDTVKVINASSAAQTSSQANDGECKTKHKTERGSKYELEAIDGLTQNDTDSSLSESSESSGLPESPESPESSSGFLLDDYSVFSIETDDFGADYFNES